MLNVYIVRHGQTDTNKTLAINGSGTNLPLNETGVKQVETLRDNFNIKNIDYVYASPLRRAKQTAEILNQGQHDIIYDNRLKEMNYGNWDGQSAAEIRSRYPQVFDELGYFNEKYAEYCDGESYEHLAARLMNFWHDLVDKYVNKSILIVFHGTASRSMIQNVLQSPDITKIGEAQNASVSKVSVDDQSKKAFLRYYNRVAPGNFFDTVN
ncbi:MULTISPECIES: histidine phosphatase family protein [unclassified Lactobacillus]|uniref:histidine phosphatase family protein n=1 Tax=unclassified Lactobacillus TaxID=2620435 RepID=UPI000EFC3AA7|nr:MULTISPECIES: histidine phosphatase family protein [unclassified Lactobacillus]RMC23851.1 histidine phosphatase family protein [Lactobacillus sp. ESL0247]RMC27595.1 histidine phosphatase family protein [Lactobacillus sp. ESL0246]RMC30875.1 histidine phosphatase family protein [Lactobacillus sp. ESL0245]RMC47617.1 histidine phosphatase family protein [Lactobacillus sp. ESL0228]